MTEEYSEDNLISRTERYLSQSVLISVKESIKTLKSCEGLMPLAETLDIPQRCIEAIAERALSADPSLFGWPVNDGRGSSNPLLWNGIETSVRRKGTSRTTTSDSWLEELALLSLPLFKRLILAMRARDLSPDVIESCLMYYAKKYIPGISRSNRKPPSSSVVSETEQRELLEAIITNLPSENSSRSSIATRFLFGLLRTANILNASEASRAALERKIGSQLEQATLDDLLIPSYSYLNETLYDVDCVERILGYFLDGLEAGIEGEIGDGSIRPPAMMLVGKLIDENARLFDDGLYRAVDVYLKAHPWVAEEEREKICGVMDCQKLTLEACTHAAQNERLPLRAVVQVLFFEQLQLRHAITGSILAAEAAPPDSGRPSNLQLEQEGESAVGAAQMSARGEQR
ncbi:BTB/POZ domain-containing protein [Vitis vinifera]|uniref:BTB/POZ domain-containing protein n=1 Tax=Vitis vinifera TaxID=29760 RepID=A0A438FB30_VITVI|nr:BTB/POZ domain-containing protein [Vitis vinifera]